MTFTSVSTAALGFPRMGPKRELKFALEKYWKGAIKAEELLSIANSVEEQTWKLQVDAGIDKITVGDFALYDNVLQWAESLGIVPERFAHMQVGIDRMFAMARGVNDATALGMKKWIDSNYHYMVPEYDESSSIRADFSFYLHNVKRGLDILGPVTATPVVLGPVSIVRLTKFHDGSKAEDIVDRLVPVYKSLISELGKLGVTEIQIHEPVLVFDESALLPLFQKAYPAIFSEGGPAVNMVSFFEDIGSDKYQWLVNLDGVSTISLDFTRGNNLGLIEANGFPAGKTLGVGIIDGRSVWKVVPESASELFEKLRSAGVQDIRVQPSSSLQFIPWDLSCETAILEHTVGQVLSFSIQKLSEVAMLANAVRGQGSLAEHEVAWKGYLDVLKEEKSVGQRLASVTESDFSRAEPFEVRRLKQLKGMPLLPTTTIGSFPQTREVRSLRTKLRKGELTEAGYNAAIDMQIAFAIGMQEALGLDILVHGEAERTDMVEFFAQKMNGIIFSSNGWVQSFGSRCVRPPIMWNDMERAVPMTIREFKVAQSITSKPVKGMLTGPVTILNWSFPRIDISRKAQAMQLGLAIRDEIADLETAGCVVVQVDEPALREGMPLRDDKKEEYLTWAVNSFRLATGGAKSETQIHTHMCYCEFDDCMHAIDALDTDVNSIENARSDNATLFAFKRIGYKKGLGPGTYDIHSPVVPPVSFIKDKIKSFLECVEVENLYINPDCGLKTRTWPETIGALKNMITANDKIREELGLRVSGDRCNEKNVDEEKKCCS